LSTDSRFRLVAHLQPRRVVTGSPAAVDALALDQRGVPDLFDVVEEVIRRVLRAAAALSVR